MGVKGGDSVKNQACVFDCASLLLRSLPWLLRRQVDVRLPRLACKASHTDPGVTPL